MESPVWVYILLIIANKQDIHVEYLHSIYSFRWERKLSCLALGFHFLFFYFCFELLINIFVFFFDWTQNRSSLINKKHVNQKTERYSTSNAKWQKEHRFLPLGGKRGKACIYVSALMAKLCLCRFVCSLYTCVKAVWVAEKGRSSKNIVQ